MSEFKRSHRHFTTEQKVAILKRHMIDKVPVSDLCNEFGLQPSVFYQWN
jgi:transposase-like protein